MSPTVRPGRSLGDAVVTRRWSLAVHGRKCWSRLASGPDRSGKSWFVNGGYGKDGENALIILKLSLSP